MGSLQARNNARVLLSGSLDLFSNEFMSMEGADNEQVQKKKMKKKMYKIDRKG